MKRLFKWAGLCLLLMMAAGGGYFALGIGLSAIPVNGDFQPPADGIEVAVIDNGIHTDLILPVSAGNTDWRTIFDPKDFTDLPSPPTTKHYMVVGWGHRDFYLRTPDWEDLTAATLLRGLFGIGGTLLHVHYWPIKPEAETIAWFRIDRRGYEQIVRQISATARRDAQGRTMVVPGATYGTRDAFFEAEGAYGPISTCNEWTRRILAQAGVRTGVWTPFSGAILAHLRVAEN